MMVDASEDVEIEKYEANRTRNTAKDNMAFPDEVETGWYLRRVYLRMSQTCYKGFHPRLDLLPLMCFVVSFTMVPFI